MWGTCMICGSRIRVRCEPGAGTMLRLQRVVRAPVRSFTSKAPCGTSLSRRQVPACCGSPSISGSATGSTASPTESRWWACRSAQPFDQDLRIAPPKGWLREPGSNRRGLSTTGYGPVTLPTTLYPASVRLKWWVGQDSNLHRLIDIAAVLQTAELNPVLSQPKETVAGAVGFEPTKSWDQNPVS